MDRAERRRLVEALILASPEPLSAARIADIVPYCKPGQAKDFVNELNTEYQEQDRAFEIWEVAGGYQIRTRAEFSGYLQKLNKQRPLRLSRAALETLSIVAYKQPATRAEVEDVRGVDVGAVLKSLLDRDLVRMVGHRDVAGRPMVYGTSKRFLEVFGLDTLKSLPTLRELEDLTREHEAAEAEAAAEEREGAAEAVADATPTDDSGETGVEEVDSAGIQDRQPDEAVDAAADVQLDDADDTDDVSDGLDDEDDTDPREEPF